MNFRTTIILLVALLGVGAYIMFTGSSTPPATINHSTAQPLLDMAANDVSKLIITPADGKRIVLERQTQSTAPPAIGPATSDWKIIEPITAYADGMKVSDLLSGIINATSTSEVPVGSASADYGLDTPQFTVDLAAGPKSAKLDIGRQVKAGNELYVRIEGKETAQVVSADLLTQVDTTADKLRLTKLINTDEKTANWISISRPKDPLAVEKVAGNWQLSLPTTRPTTMPAEPSVVTDLVTSIGSAQAVAFAKDTDNPDLLIGQPHATLTISDQRPSTQPSSQTETIEFGSPDSLLGKNIWVRITPPGVVATITKESMDAMLKTPLDLRGREVLRITPADVTEIRIVKNIPPTTQPIALPARLHQVILTRRPPKKVDLTAVPPAPTTQPTTGPTTLASTQPTTLPAVPPKPESVWQITGNLTPADADDGKVDVALNSFNPLRADKYIETAPSSEGKTTYLVTLVLRTGPPVQVTLCDPGEGSTDPVVASSGDAIFNVSRSVITSLDADFTLKP